MPTYLLSTNAGLEQLTQNEIKQKTNAKTETTPFNRQSYVQATTSNEKPLRSLRSIHHIHQYITSFTFTDLDDLLHQFKNTHFPNLNKHTTFRCTCNRSGTHTFGSMDVARKTGTIIDNKGLTVDLENHDLEIYLDIQDNHCIVTYKLTKNALSNRHNKKHHHGASLKTNVAYALIRKTNISDGTILDPFIGSATILLELHDINPNYDLYGSDRYNDALTEAKTNLDINNVQATLKQADARDLQDEYPNKTFDALITNPPWGLKSGTHSDIYWLYRKFLTGAQHILKPNGTLTALIMKKQIFKDALNETNLTLTEHHQIYVGTITTNILIAKKP